jgi:threonine/homoserine/homoserine lactone efflux protein
MDFTAFGRGLLLGLAVAAPVGPMSVLCMRRTVAAGFRTGLLSGLGIATADALYGAIAASGLVALTAFVVGQQQALRLIGGMALLYLGLKTFRAPPAMAPAAGGVADLAASYLSTLGLTLTNPATILSFTALFAGLGLGAERGAWTTASAMVLGVFVGSALWWVVLTGVMSAARRRLEDRLLRFSNRLSGLALITFGAVALVSLLPRC